MPMEDAARWNERYHNLPGSERPAARELLVEHHHWLPPHGLGLDIAMGLGANAAFLMQHGLRVIGVDIAGQAVRQAKTTYPELMAVMADMTDFVLPSASFDVILNFYYLQRDLWPAFARLLRPNGLLIYETLTRSMLTVRPDLPADFLLEENELKTAFAGWRILYYREGWFPSAHGRQKAIASLIARPPES